MLRCAYADENSAENRNDNNRTGGTPLTHSLRILQQEHQNLARLLDIMEEQIGDIDASQAPDYRLLQTIADYLSGYPDEVHHPKEDLIFRRLERRDSDAASKLGRILDEHTELREFTKKFAAIVVDSTSSIASRPKQIVQSAEELVGYYRHHIEMEEKYFFPAARRVLNRDDWAEIDYALSERTDPLFDETVTKYAEVRANILRINKASQNRHLANAQLKKDKAALTRLDDLPQFNLMMEERGIVAHLEYHAGIGYRLITREHDVVEIPDCSESRAMWCAFYYLKGKGR